MSAHAAVKRITAPQIKSRKGGEPLVSLTAYQAYSARIADPYCDFLLVGDSVGMVVHGFDSTLPVTLEMMILHGKAVMRGTERAMVVIELPFGSYEESPQQAFRNASQIMAETGCGAVKLEGIVEPLAVKITRQATIPTIGIGASNRCDGQILVMEDMLGFGDWVPKFVRRYGGLGEAMDVAIKNYASDVKSRSFPGQAEIYK